MTTAEPRCGLSARDTGLSQGSLLAWLRLPENHTAIRDPSHSSHLPVPGLGAPPPPCSLPGPSQVPPPQKSLACLLLSPDSPGRLHWGEGTAMGGGGTTACAGERAGLWGGGHLCPGRETAGLQGMGGGGQLCPVGLSPPGHTQPGPGSAARPPRTSVSRLSTHGSPSPTEVQFPTCRLDSPGR